MPLSVPGSPSELRAITNSSKIITLHWGDPLPATGVIRWYVITYAKNGSETTIMNISDSNSKVIDGLEIWTEYEFRIRACTSIGCGLESNITWRTDEDSESLDCSAICPTLYRHPTFQSNL